MSKKVISAMAHKFPVIPAKAGILRFPIKTFGNDMGSNRGQTALILILLVAAALIFLAITLNWGRIAQTKVLLTIAADHSASQLASDAASYGEMQKQTYLKNTNQIKEQNGFLISIIMLVVAIGMLFIPGLEGFGAFLVITSVVMAAANLVLQLVVVQPGITSLWNSLQKNQPVTQQFYEGGVVAALESSIGDRVNITDYFDWNANGIFGKTNNAANDAVSRFAVFYTDRLKMLNQPLIPQVVFFYNQLSELINGETCDQNESDYKSYPGVITLNPACAALNGNTGQQYCNNDPIDPACQMKIPNVFQLNDACTGSDPANVATYNPYCDPCCQPLNKPNPLNPGLTIPVRPSNCSSGTSNYGAAAGTCLTNNPYGGASSQYTLLYDPAYQDYANGVSFLAQFGRDQQRGPFATALTPQGNFPNGIYPFFWLMNDYSPEVDTINPTKPLPSSQLHWCDKSITPSYTAPAGYPSLAQLNLANSSGYSCQGQDCCVNFLADTVGPDGVTPISDGTANGTTNGAIDMVGSPSFGSNPALDPGFGEGSPGSGTWLPGDNQVCSTPMTASPYGLPYNGADSNNPDGTCEWTGSTAPPPPTASPSPAGNMTVDSLDDAMHTLSDFVNFSNAFLSKDVGTLSSTFKTWYPQAAGWIDPASTSNDKGRLLSIYDPAGYPNIPGYSNNTTPVDELKGWNTVITNWLNTVYTSNSAWCVPSETTLLNGNSSTDEDTYINSNSGTTTWGDLPHVVACLNYNSGAQIYNGTTRTGSVYDYQQCLNLLTNNCPASLQGTACDPLILGRSLAGPAPAFDGNCDVTQAGSYAQWVSDSFTLATDEAPKFALRSAFLTDVYTRAQTMSKIFQAGDQALSVFFKSCSSADSACQSGGPAAQLIYANSQPSPTSLLPNSVIYGWVDNPRPNGQQGYAHIVKVTAYSPGRGGSFAASVLPWIKTSSSLLTRSYTLTDRDGPVYVSVKRWDEDHSRSVLFPNGHLLWQFLFHNPQTSSGSTSGQGLMQACNGLTLSGGGHIGFGLEPQTVAGLGYVGISPQDQTALANAFMLNDRGDGSVDLIAKANNGAYLSCLTAANGLLDFAPESHACAQYIASRNASGASGNGDSDYSLKFFSCPRQPEDL